MNTYFKLLIFLFVFNLSFAQLTVRENAYIFVSDEVVYVEDYVRLRESNSKFYLRDEGQLIQGAGSTGNSGVGQLSVFQNGSVDNYAYNYWCSPVGNTDTNAFGNTSYRPNNNMYDWIGNTDPALHQITSSAASFTSSLDGINSPLTISDRWLFSFNPGTDYSDWDHIGSTGTLASGYGFSMKGSMGSLNQLYDFRGKPNSGDIPTAVLNGEITLVGNPFPSALDALDYIHDPVNNGLLNGSLYFWEHDLSVNSHFIADYIGGYASYTINAAGNVETFITASFDTYNGDGSFNTAGTASTSGKVVRRFIPIGQGFMVEAVASGTVYAKNSHREYYKQSSPNSVFFRGTEPSNDTNQIYQITYNDQGLQIMPEDYKRFRLNIDFNDDYSFQLIQNFNDSATPGFDYGIEIKQNNDINSEVYFKNSGEENQILAQANKFDLDLRIPLYIDLTEQKNIRIRIYDVQNFDPTQEIFIHDISSNTYHNLRETNFETILNSGTHDSKFEITFRDFTKNLEIKNQTSHVSLYQNNKTDILTVSNPNNLKIKEINVYDILGKKILNKNNINNESRYEISTKDLNQGTYIVKVNLSEDINILNKKVIIKNSN